MVPVSWAVWLNAPDVNKTEKANKTGAFFMEILVGSVVRRLRHCQALTWKAMESCVALESPQMERAVIFFALLTAAPVGRADFRSGCSQYCNPGHEYAL